MAKGKKEGIGFNVAFNSLHPMAKGEKELFYVTFHSLHHMAKGKKDFFCGFQQFASYDKGREGIIFMWLSTACII